MDPGLVVFTCFCIVLALEGYYFGFRKLPEILQWLHQAIFIKVFRLGYFTL
ncbi:MAG: hypothetical protein JW957_08880 [Candidatus Omnitrophica bacterium]|nr:hypothetical protein [Candidatus Omnitrophota bacterium]